MWPILRVNFLRTTTRCWPSFAVGAATSFISASTGRENGLRNKKSSAGVGVVLRFCCLSVITEEVKENFGLKHPLSNKFSSNDPRLCPQVDNREIKKEMESRLSTEACISKQPVYCKSQVSQDRISPVDVDFLSHVVAVKLTWRFGCLLRSRSDC